MDALVAIDGIKVPAAPGALDALLSRYQAGDVVAMHVFRRDELRCFNVRLTAPSAAEYTLQDLTR